MKSLRDSFLIDESLNQKRTRAQLALGTSGQDAAADRKETYREPGVPDKRTTRDCSRLVENNSSKLIKAFNKSYCYVMILFRS